MESAVNLSRRSGRACALGLIAGVACGLAAHPASAEGLFDFLFGGQQRQAPRSANSYADPNPFGSQPAEPRVEAGPTISFCVRLCDGGYFPIQRVSGSNAAQVCSSFCPAARTKVFSGGEINYSTAQDGARYKDLPNAFVYRDRTVADCTCNGKDPYGLVTTDASADPTLRPGDIVATEHGFVAYSGGGRRNAEFTPIGSYRGLSAELRHQLAGAKIEPRDATARPEPGLPAVSAKSAQLDR
jgi:Protein of unknown function (DUF2865)